MDVKGKTERRLKVNKRKVEENRKENDWSSN